MVVDKKSVWLYRIAQYLDFAIIYFSIYNIVDNGMIVSGGSFGVGIVEGGCIMETPLILESKSYYVMLAIAAIVGFFIILNQYVTLFLAGFGSIGIAGIFCFDDVYKPYLFENKIFIVCIIISAIVLFALGIINAKCTTSNDSSKIIRKIVRALLIVVLVALLFVLLKPLFLVAVFDTRIDKPIIYLYPEEETSVSVKLGNEDDLTCTYPQYNNGWNVVASPNGDLLDEATGKHYYALYWEGKNAHSKVSDIGFCVKGEDSAKFLEDKLAVLGLNERESEEFIVYWLPKLESKEYNYIRFLTIDEINEYMPLNISPKPDSVIRVVMEFKGLNKPIDIKEQELQAPARDGFTVVEWGASEIK